MTLAEPIRASIERWARELLDTSALLRLAQSGGMTSRALEYYLTSLQYLLVHSQRNLTVAAARSEELEYAELAEYFGRKASEEQGHDKWATDDLAQLRDPASQGNLPSEWIVKLVELQRALIQRHPACFVVYALWAEYFTVLVGDAWLDALASCGYPRTQVSSIANHLDTDREHAARGFDEIDRLWNGQPECAVMMGVVQQAAALFEAFCDDVCGQARFAA